MNFLRISRPIDSIFSETIFRIAGFPINNSTLFMILILVLIALLCFFVIRRFKLNPNKTQCVVEIIYEGIEDILLQLTGSRRKASALFPFIGALFIFVGAANLLSIVPGLTSFIWDGKPAFRAPTADFNTTFSLAVSAIFIIQLASIRDYGFFGYIGKFLKFKEVCLGFKKGLGEGFISIIDFLIGLLDIIGEIAKIISLSLRLFGNIYAGIVLMTVIFGYLAYLLPSAWMALGLLSAVVQTIVFGSLVAAYYILATKPKEEEI